MFCLLTPHLVYSLWMLDALAPQTCTLMSVTNSKEVQVELLIDAMSVPLYVKHIIHSALTVKNLQSAFMKIGIYPFNLDKVDTTLFQANEFRASIQMEVEDYANQGSLLDERPTEHVNDFTKTLPNSENELVPPYVPVGPI